VSRAGRPGRRSGWAMNEILEQRSAGNGHLGCDAAAPIEPNEVEGVEIMKIGINRASANFDNTVLAESFSSRWREDRRYFALIRQARGARLEASWLQQPANSALELRWSLRCRCIPSAELPPPLQASLLEGAA
jgi:hypothetical protein